QGKIAHTQFAAQRSGSGVPELQSTARRVLSQRRQRFALVTATGLRQRTRREGGLN
ncbi:hypothetical protein AAFF_G00111700, partial [Aldrovandia affinis]